MDIAIVEAETMNPNLPLQHWKAGALFLVLAGLGLLGGCNDKNKIGGGVEAPAGMLNAWRLADQLNLTVVQLSHCSATFEGRGNSVIIYANPDGQAYVNGHPVGPKGEIVCMGNEIFVPPSLVAPLRAALRMPPQVAVNPPKPPRSEPPHGPFRGTIVIDAGHGGKDPGALAVTGAKEKYVVLAVARSLATKLQQRGAKVILTRANDTFLELEERAEVANRSGADLFVSIHADSAPGNRSATGFAVYVSRSASASSRFAAETIARGMCGTGLDNRGVKSADYRVLVKSRCPAVLIELGFLSNYSDANKLANDGFQDRLADAICDGIARIMAKK